MYIYKISAFLFYFSKEMIDRSNVKGEIEKKYIYISTCLNKEWVKKKEKSMIDRSNTHNIIPSEIFPSEFHYAPLS